MAAEGGNSIRIPKDFSNVNRPTIPAESISGPTFEPAEVFGTVPATDINLLKLDRSHP